jgi:hypothetical protein
MHRRPTHAQEKHMRSSNRRRTLAVTAGGAIVAALAWLPLGSASAGVHNTFSVGGSSQSDYTGTVGPNICQVTAGSTSVSTTPITFSSGTRSQSASLSTTFTSTASSADVTSVSGHYRGSLTVATHRGDLAGFTMGGSGSLAITRALGAATQCDTSAVMGVTSMTDFTESRAGWLYVTRDTTKPAETIFIAVDNTHQRVVVFDEFFGAASRATERGFMSPGLFTIPEWIVAVTAGNAGGIVLRSGGTVDRSSLDSQMTGTFYGAGSAYGGVKGSAGRFVRFPAAVSCSHHTATLTWKSGASKVAGGSFFVNGKKKGSVSHPRPGRHVVLRHLGGTADNRISVRISLDGGGRATAARAYVPCKG